LVVTKETFPQLQRHNHKACPDLLEPARSFTVHRPKT
jgi:hypothetical protein